VLPPANDFYYWDQLTFFTQWRSSTDMVIMCFGLTTELRDEVRKSLKGSPQLLIASSPYDAHAFILPFVVRVFDTSVWMWRDWIRESESRRHDNANSRAAFLAMHELARHAIHSTETLTSALVVVRSIIDEQRERSPLLHTASTLDVNTNRVFQHQKTLLEILLSRSQALERRLQNEINLVGTFDKICRVLSLTCT
jgi:hypothetical protein